MIFFFVKRNYKNRVFFKHMKPTLNIFVYKGINYRLKTIGDLNQKKNLNVIVVDNLFCLNMSNTNL